MTHLAGKWYWKLVNYVIVQDSIIICFWWCIIQKFIFFSYCSMSWKILLSLHFIFQLCLQTNEQCYHLLRLTNHSSAFHPVSGTKLNMLYPALVSGTRKIWHQKSMTDWPVSGTRWLVPEAGTWNWPVCHQYKLTLKAWLGLNFSSMQPIRLKYINRNTPGCAGHCVLFAIASDYQCKLQWVTCFCGNFIAEICRIWSYYLIFWHYIEMILVEMKHICSRPSV